MQPHERMFNFRHIRTRRGVEQAFGRLKERFRIIEHNSICDPVFASYIAVVCSALHNACDWWTNPADTTWTIKEALYHPGPNDQYNQVVYGNDDVIHNATATRVHQCCPYSMSNSFHSC